MKNLKSSTLSSWMVKTILGFALALLISLTYAPSSLVHAASRCDGLPSTERGVCLADPDKYFSDPTGEGLFGLAPRIINLLSVIVGVISVIMIIVGGLKYITSSGEPGNITSAKNTILYAVIGLVIVAFAQIIVLFVLDSVT